MPIRTEVGLNAAQTSRLTSSYKSAVIFVRRVTSCEFRNQLSRSADHGRELRFCLRAMNLCADRLNTCWDIPTNFLIGLPLFSVWRRQRRYVHSPQSLVCISGYNPGLAIRAGAWLFGESILQSGHSGRSSFQLHKSLLNLSMLSWIRSSILQSPSTGL